MVEVRSVADAITRAESRVFKAFETCVFAGIRAIFAVRATFGAL